MTDQIVPGRFADRVAIVTGASRGIGAATARRLAAEGAAIVANARKRADLENLVNDVNDAGGRAVAVEGDITNPDTPALLVGAAVAQFGGVDVIVNNAALSKHYGPLLACNARAFQATVLGNCWPQLAIVQEAMAAGMGTTKPGAIVNVSSIGAHNKHPLTGPYNAGKMAMETLVPTLAAELGPRNVRINVVAPGLIRTDLSKVFWNGAQEDVESQQLPLQRIGEPADVAALICFLASNESSWITGVTVPVDGGRLTLGGTPQDGVGTTS